MDDLTKLVVSYQNGEAEFKTLQSEVALEVFSALQKAVSREEELLADFLVDFYPYIEGLVSRFEWNGTPFRHFLLRTVKFRWRSFWKQERAKRAKEYSVENDDSWFVCESPVNSWEEESGKSAYDRLIEGLSNLKKFDDATKRRLVWLTLKAAQFVTQDQVEAICRATDTDLSWMDACLFRIRTQLEEKVARKRALSDRYTALHVRSVETQVQNANEPSSSRQKLWQERAEWFSGKLRRIQRESSSIHLSPSHADLAKLLNVPKGSVDSGMYLLKKELTRVELKKEFSSTDLLKVQSGE